MPTCMFCRQEVEEHLSTCRAARASALSLRQRDGREPDRRTHLLNIARAKTETWIGRK